MNIKQSECDTHYHFKLPTILKVVIQRKAKKIGSSCSELMRYLLRGVYQIEDYPSDEILRNMIISERAEVELNKEYKAGIKEIERNVLQEIN